MKPRFLLISSLTLLGVALAAALWMRDLRASAAGYESPIHEALPSGSPTTPLVSQVVVVVARELTSDTLPAMPFLGSLARQGATGRLALAPNAHVTDVLTGAGPDLARPGAGAPALETIFATVRRINGLSIVAGTPEWLAQARPDVADAFAAPSEDEAGDQAVISHVLGRLDFWLPNLALVTLASPPMTATLAVTPISVPPPSTPTAVLVTSPTPSSGSPAVMATAVATGNSEPALSVIPATDARLSAIWQMMQTRKPGGVVLVVLGDSPGAPIILAGHDVQPVQMGALTPGDLTLTVAAMLGAPLPSASAGRVQLAALSMNEAQQAEKQIAQAQQRVVLADAYLAGIGAGPTTEVVTSDLLVARSASAAHNADSAFRLASHSLSQADAELAAGRSERLASERRSRLPVMVFAALPLIYALVSFLAAAVARSSLATALGLAPWRILRRWRPETLIGVPAGAAVWVSFEWLAQTQPRWPLLPWVLVIGGGCILAGAWLADHHFTSAAERRGRAATEATRVRGPVALCGFGLTFTYLTALLPASIYYAQGRLVTWFLPDPAGIALLDSSLGLLFMVALLAGWLPWVGALLQGAAGLGGWVWERRGPR